MEADSRARICGWSSSSLSYLVPVVAVCIRTLPPDIRVVYSCRYDLTSCGDQERPHRRWQMRIHREWSPRLALYPIEQHRSRMFQIIQDSSSISTRRRSELGSVRYESMNKSKPRGLPSVEPRVPFLVHLLKADGRLADGSEYSAWGLG